MPPRKSKKKSTKKGKSRKKTSSSSSSRSGMSASAKRNLGIAGGSVALGGVVFLVAYRYFRNKGKSRAEATAEATKIVTSFQQEIKAIGKDPVRDAKLYGQIGSGHMHPDRRKALVEALDKRFRGSARPSPYKDLPNPGTHPGSYGDLVAPKDFDVDLMNPAAISP